MKWNYSKGEIALVRKLKGIGRKDGRTPEIFQEKSLKIIHARGVTLYRREDKESPSPFKWSTTRTEIERDKKIDREFSTWHTVKYASNVLLPAPGRRRAPVFPFVLPPHYSRPSLFLPPEQQEAVPPPPPAFRTPPANIFIKLSATPLSTRALTLLRRKIFSGGRCLDQPERRERENHRKIYSPRRVFLFSIYSSVSLDGMGRSTGDDIAQWLKGREGYRLWG